MPFFGSILTVLSANRPYPLPYAVSSDRVLQTLALPRVLPLMIYLALKCACSWLQTSILVALS